MLDSKPGEISAWNSSFNMELSSCTWQIQACHSRQRQFSSRVFWMFFQKNPKFWWADLFLGIWLVCMSLWISLFLVFDFILEEISLLSNQVQVLVGCVIVWLFVGLIGLVCHQKQFLLCKPGSDFSTFLVWTSLGISYRKASNLAGSWWC